MDATALPIFSIAASMLLLVTTSLAVSLFILSHFGLFEASLSTRKIVPSPRETLIPFISTEESIQLPYHPNHIPGGRDVNTPYGVMRVYEWGPINGKKVLMVHGDTTPAPILSPIAHALVRKGCRVILFDLWGRGYSDSPLDMAHDARLYSLQIFFAAASSQLPWIDASSDGFSIIAFSSGGGTTMRFLVDFHFLVNSVILLAPAGLLPNLPEGYNSRVFRYSQIVPFTILKRCVADILGVWSKSFTASLSKIGEGAGSLVTIKENFDIPAVLAWQLRSHKGFVYSFIDNVKHGPLMNQHTIWRKVFKIVGEEAHAKASNRASKLAGNKILVIFGESDEVVRGSDLMRDMPKMVADTSCLDFQSVPGDHGFPTTSSAEIVKHILHFWKL
ncbi:MAG: hypothetical protein M1822_000713 [Bathelium mastoideum]|nr:MAG: hypothetical protein M1822_000713 [Bathelium mastoideum]